MSDQVSPAVSCTVGAVVRCDRCGHDWPAGCEQAVAIRKRGKCIVCLIALGEHFSMAPYEFPSDPGYTPNARPHAEAVADSVQAEVGGVR